MAIHTKVRVMGDGFAMLEINSRLALCYKALKKPGKGGRKDRIQCGYFGFDTEAQANFFADYLKQRFIPFGPRVHIRESDRLPDSAWEVKVWDFPQLLQLVHECHDKHKQREQQEPQIPFAA
jgi:hypothetical protein